MKMSNKDKPVDDHEGLDEGTYKLAVGNQCFASSTKVVRTRTDERALATGGAK